MAYASPTFTDDGPAGIAVEMMLDYREQTGRLVPEASIEAALFEVIGRAQYLTRLAVNHNAEEVMAAVAGFHGIDRHPARPARLAITVEGTQGVTLPAGTVLISQDQHHWSIMDDLTIGVTGQGQGRAVCQWDGPVEQEALGPMHQLGPVAGVTQITATAIQDHGADQEPLWEYLDRAIEQLQFQSIVPRLPFEFAAYARRHPAVHSAKAVNLYDHSTGQTPKAGHITVYVANKQGTPIDKSTMDEIKAMMNASTNRPLGVLVHVAQPTRVPVMVDVTTQPDSLEVSKQVKDRIARWGDPASWPWDDNKITDLDIARAIGTDIPGLEVPFITLNGTGQVILRDGSEPFAVPAFTITVNGH